ncbi:SusC/RagA family TonB-linked outer membrane protein [Bacteroides thetaiotaomicron]|uniref:SusC/RagA family TonB-linked outer membrane protein n=1 Tax=Bacteroides thetaiotaomicron TaxID=818 RepID=UPI00268BA246
MKDFFTPMKIPQKWVCLLAMSFVFGQQAFSSENYVTESIAVSADIMQQKSKTVVGTVTDNGEPIIGASVVVKNAGKGVITDMDGNFKLDVPVGATIVISYVGYDSKEIVYKGESTLKVELSEDVLQLQEVQVVAYGVTKKVTVTGAISSVGTEEILKSPVSSISNALTGKLPGLSTVQQTGQPGADDATMYVRGVGSLTEGLSSPLVLVDGVERSFNQLDPNEIEDISILKDASSTAVFGVRGANGVILVTTKRGQEGKPKINVSTSYSLQMPTRMPEFANSYEYASTYVNAQRRDGIESNFAFTDEAIEAYRTHSNPLAYPDTDWVDMLIKDVALQTQHNFSISGGTRGVRYFASLGVLTQDGLFKSFEKEYDGNFKYNRYNYRINLDLDLTKTTLMRMNLGGRVNDKRTPNYEGSSDIGLLFRDIYWAIPMSGVGIMDGKWIWPDTKEFSLPGTVRDGLYPYYGKGYNTSAGNILNFDFMLEQKLNFITKGLKAHVKASYNSGVTLKKLRKTSYPHYETIVNEDGTVNLRKVGDQTNLQYSESTSRSRDWYMEVAMNYKRDFGDHHVSALAMYNQTMKYYPDSNPDEFKSIPRSYIGLVGRATYDWKTRYMVEMNVGYNGSENFAPGKRFGLFPAVSAGWVLTEENFMQPLKPWLSYFKLRASYGVVGNDRVSGNYRFLYLPDSYNPSTGSYYFGNSISTAWQGAVESKIGNPDVTWETAAKQNYGVDAYFINSKLKVNFDYFIERRKDILTNRKVLPTYLAANLPIAILAKLIIKDMN